MSTEKRPLKVFLSYASQDRPVVREIYDALKREDWIDPWLDQEMILPGQDWQMVIETAVNEADVVIICLSNRSVPKEGYVQKEIRYAYDIALEKPDETIFLIPLRLDECDIPRKLRFLQKVDYFGVEKNSAYSDLLDALKIRYEQKLTMEAADRDRRESRRLDGTAAENAAVKELKQVDDRKTTPKKPNPKPAENSGRQGTSPAEKSTKKRRRRKIDPAIIAAIIGVLGTIVVALIQFYATRQTTLPTLTSSLTAFTATSTNTVVNTNTAAPNTPTFTPVPATDTPIPTPTGIPPVELGSDWIEGCVSTLWRPYPVKITVTERGDGCWNEPVYVFYAENGDLDVLGQGNNEELEIYGLFAPLPESGRVNLTVRLNELTSVDVWMGIFAEPDVNSQGLLMTIPTGNVLERVVVQKDPQTNETITGTSLLEQGKGFSFSFTFNANSARGTVNPSVFFTESVSIPSSQKWLFLGYKSLLGYYRIEGRFLEFELE